MGRLEPTTTSRRRPSHRWTPLLLAATLSLLYYLSDHRIQLVHIPANTAAFKPCSPPLPTLLATKPPSADNPMFKKAAGSLNAFLSARTSSSDIDSLSIGVITPAGAIFEGFYGTLRANETSGGSVDRDTIYRIASITKMFTTLETLILRERGQLSWDDPVTKFIPNFTNPSSGWSEHLHSTETSFEKSPVTLRQLASHLSGIGRDYPPYDVGEWPARLPTNDPEDEHESEGRMHGTLAVLLDAIATTPLVADQYTFPVYSNAGFDVLGACNVGAHELATGNVTTHAELLRADVFEPLGLNSSFYKIPSDKLAAQIAIPRIDSSWADLAFSDVFAPAGGQYSSLADLTKVMQSFLSPKPHGVVSPYVMREWLRPLHAWSDGFQEVGAPWEIAKVGQDSEARLYSKGGNLPGYHSQFVLNPQWSYGVVVLVTGTYTDTATLAREAIDRFQPAFKQELVNQVADAYTGIWIGDDSVVIVTLENDELFLQTLIVGDQDVLSLLQQNPPKGSQPVALWSTGRLGEFRLAIGRPELNGNPDAGCEPYWVSIDFPTARGAPLDLIFWDGDELFYPSAGVKLRRGQT
ncbi:Beta-lactamase domain-containing protein [Mycena kentingensis (nom. inval.)]|nr:Beta-lactamase domain-containing protein [Mycena kentingensis (nom. inval.)]